MHFGWLCSSLSLGSLGSLRVHAHVRTYVCSSYLTLLSLLYLCCGYVTVFAVRTCGMCSSRTEDNF